MLVSPMKLSTSGGVLVRVARQDCPWKGTGSSCDNSLSARPKTVTVFGARQLVVMGVLAAVAVTAGGGASAQSVSALTQPQAPAKPVKPMTPERTAWLKKRCAQLVALFDYYNVSRGENSDGPRNHTRIGAVIECERSNYRYGIDTMATLLLHKAEEIPKPDIPAFEPEDAEAPDITNPTRAWW
jgi:hypothetical protein